MADISIAQSGSVPSAPDSGVWDEVSLSSRDFQFVYHNDPDRFFEGSSRPLRLIRRSPSLTTYENAVYVPASRAPREALGCLYDAAGTRIEDSITRRGRVDKELSTDPPQLTIDAGSLPLHDRPVLYLGLLRPHFGHYLMESLSYWWALAQEHPDVDRYLVHVINPQHLEKHVVKATLDAMGIPRDRLLYFDEPVRLSKVIVPASSFQAKSHIYTRYSETMRKLAVGLGAESARPTDQPLYLSRTQETGGVRRYDGEEQIESYLIERGVRVIHPAQLPLSEQVRAVNEHKVLIGFQGSQMMNSMFSLQPRTVIHFTDDDVWPNTVLIDRCFDNQATYVKVSEYQSRVREGYRSLMARLLGKKLKFDGFRTWHQVDHQRAIAWLESSGLV